ncbi:MAG: 3-dehydroquinate synthase [Deltaproteobacteria bacterium]|nr:3-dehydroquinate synthase [Deltaproteobacteria bacterium]
MRSLKIPGARSNSTVYLGESLRSLPNYIPGENAVILSDANVRRLHGPQFPPCRLIEIDSGERVKSLDTVLDIYRRLAEMEVDRSSFLIGIGGGIVCDITGFVATTYLRGLRFGFVPSTLLSQVDASVGGKNGVNLDGYKNIIGTFNQPDFVICDTGLLRTLPRTEISNGFAEVVKHALIGDASLFSHLERNLEDVLKLDRRRMEKIIHDSLVIKTEIVKRDERETGIRRKLNFGHTLGHAIEKSTGIPHGEAVSVGMCFAARFSQEKGYLGEEEVNRIQKLLGNLGLPTALDCYDIDALFEGVGKDKKREKEKIHFVFLQGVGDAVVEEVHLEELFDFLRSFT